MIGDRSGTVKGCSDRVSLGKRADRHRQGIRSDRERFPQPARRLVSVSRLVCDYSFLPFGSICAPESIIGAAPLSDQRFDEPIL